MKTDRLFIFISVVLLMLFAAAILRNISSTIFFERPFDKLRGVENSTSEILTRLENAGLEPREAKYYE